MQNLHLSDHRLCLPLPDLSRKIEGDSVRRVLYGQPVLTFDKRQICEEILKELRFNVIKNLLSLFFINGFITMCNLKKRLIRSAF